jgi:dihydroneopterin aldolase
VDYGSLAGPVAGVGRPRKLLEAVAEDVAQLVLADERVRQVRVRLTKPQASLPVDGCVAVEITRDRETTGEGRP